jgi:hypothetical protein
MFRNQLCLAAIVASFVFVFGTTNVEARHCGSHHKSHGCCKVRDHGCGHRVHRRHAKGCHQASCVAPSACCQPEPTCCGALSADHGAETHDAKLAPQPSDVAPPAPAPSN